MVSPSSLSKKVIVFLLSLTFMFNTHASTAVGGWTVGDAVVQGATSTWNATKEVGGKLVSGVASIKPTPAQIAKGAARFGVGLLITAATQELLDGVDYVLDPNNNSIRFKPKPTSTSYKLTFPYEKEYSSFDALAQDQCHSYFRPGSYNGRYTINSGDINNGSAYLICKLDTPTVDGPDQRVFVIFGAGTQEQKEKSIPISTVATQLITDAENGDAEAQKRIATVANTALAQPIAQEEEIVPPISIINQFEATAKPAEAETDVKVPPGVAVPPITAPTTGTQTGTATDTTTANPNTGTGSDTGFKLPTFCSWATKVCTFTEYVEKTYTDAKTAVTDYFKEPEIDKDKDDTLDIEDNKDDKKDVDTKISFGGSCPSPIRIPVSFGEVSQDIELSFSNFCDLASFIKPIVILSASYLGALIIAGIRGSED